MTIPAALTVRLPAIAAPMFLTSGPDLVVEVCRSGVIGTFPALNQRTSAGFESWLDEIADRLARHEAPASFGVNLIVHKSNPRLDEENARRAHFRAASMAQQSPEPCRTRPTRRILRPRLI